MDLKKVVAADVARTTSQILQFLKLVDLSYVLNRVAGASTLSFVMANTALSRLDAGAQTHGFMDLRLWASFIPEQLFLVATRCCIGGVCGSLGHTKRFLAKGSYYSLDRALEGGGREHASRWSRNGDAVFLCKSLLRNHSVGCNRIPDTHVHASQHGSNNSTFARLEYWLLLVAFSFDTYPPVLVPPMRSKYFDGFGSFSNPSAFATSCMIFSSIKRLDIPRIPPPSCASLDLRAS